MQLEEISEDVLEQVSSLPVQFRFGHRTGANNHVSHNHMRESVDPANLWHAHFAATCTSLCT